MFFFKSVFVCSPVSQQQTASRLFRVSESPDWYRRRIFKPFFKFPRPWNYSLPKNGVVCGPTTIIRWYIPPCVSSHSFIFQLNCSLSTSFHFDHFYGLHIHHLTFQSFHNIYVRVRTFIHSTTSPWQKKTRDERIIECKKARTELIIPKKCTVMTNNAKQTPP